MAGFFDFDWRRLFRWCCLLTVVMVIWLLVPTIKCSFKAFEDTPIGDVDSNNVADSDKERVQQGTGFWSKWGHAIKGCYAEKPLLGQESWKKGLLFLFVGLGAVAWTLDRIEKRRKRTYDR
jgi:hypothetical protein